MKYALIDTANTFFRARHVANRNTDTWEKIGMAMPILSQHRHMGEDWHGYALDNVLCQSGSAHVRR